jgi:hypothetical protein
MRCWSADAGERKRDLRLWTIAETRMPNRPAAAFLFALLSTGALAADVDAVLAQGTVPSLPGAPQPTPNLPGARLPQTSPGGSGSYSISAAANEHAAYLWVVDNIQHAVVLCEKTDGGRDFACTKKPLP